MAPGALTQVLRQLPTSDDEDLIVGFDTSDDASAYRLGKYSGEDVIMLQSVDMFPPVVDDPYSFGCIAAANALSDIYAMGGDPKFAMNILCCPEDLDETAIGEMIRGGYDKVREAGAIITGGHTIKDREPKYGMSVTGFTKEANLWANSKSEDGDILILTKPLGSGILSTAAQANLIGEDVVEELIYTMARLNKYAKDALEGFEVHGCTDVTGFGFLGHCREMAEGSGKTLVINSASVPCMTEAVEMAEMGIIPAGAYGNREFLSCQVQIGDNVLLAVQDVMFDPQTSGGLLLAIGEDVAADALKAIRKVEPKAKMVGKVTASRGVGVVVE